METNFTRDDLTAQLAAGDLRAGYFATQCNAHIIDAADLVAFDPKLQSLRNVNDQAAYEMALRELSR